MKILKVIVGSRAHGLDTPESDTDYASVVAVPTTDVLKIGQQFKDRHNVNGSEDNVIYEIKHFLALSMKSNPTVLELFKAPAEYKHSIFGQPLLDLFPYVWSSQGAKSAALGYSRDQYNRFIKNTETRSRKYAATTIRVLYQAYQLLLTGNFNIRVVDSSIGEQLINFKNGWFSTEEFLEARNFWEEKVKSAFDSNPNKESDVNKVNEYLLWLRKENW